MSTPTTLRFRAKGTALVTDFDRLHNGGSRAFIGRKYTEIAPGRFAFVPVDEDVVIPETTVHRAEYIKACGDGDLFPADEATARVCNVYAKAHGYPAVTFDPHFGKEAPAAPTPTPPTTQDALPDVLDPAHAEHEHGAAVEHDAHT